MRTDFSQSERWECVSLPRCWFWLRESREGGADGARALPQSLAPSLQLYTYTERETREVGRDWAVSLLKQVSFLQTLILTPFVHETK